METCMSQINIRAIILAPASPLATFASSVGNNRTKARQCFIDCLQVPIYMVSIYFTSLLIKLAHSDACHTGWKKQQVLLLPETRA